RSAEALELAREGLALVAKAGLESPWLSLTIAEICFELGEWDETRERVHAERPGGKGAGFAFYHALCRVELALAEGRTEQALQLLEATAERARSSRDTQWHAIIGDLSGETLRRARRFDAGRQALETAHERMTPPGGRPIEDHLRLARLAATTAAL